MVATANPMRTDVAQPQVSTALPAAGGACFRGLRGGGFCLMVHGTAWATQSKRPP